MTVNRTIQSREKRIYRVTIVGAVSNTLLLLLKLIAAIIGHSAAMMADAIHSLSDFVTDVIVLVFVKVSGKPQDEDHGYGHGKYETMATLIVGLILLMVGGGILWSGASSIWAYGHGQPLEAPGWIAFVAALVSILVKELIYRYTVKVGTEVDSQVVIANAWHHRSDALSSMGTALGIGGALMLGPKAVVLDPLAAVIVSFFIIKVALKLIVPCLDELMEKSLPKEYEQDIQQIILSFPGVTEPHNLRTRRIGSRIAIDLHVRMDGSLSLREAHDTTVIIERKIREKFGMGTYVTIHVEPVRTSEP